MRVVRSLLLICAVALTAAGCAYQPRVQFGAAPAGAPQGIDNVVYGATPAPVAPAAYNAPAPGYRGLLGSTSFAPAPAPAVIRPAPIMTAPTAAPMAGPIMAGPMPGPMAAPMPAPLPVAAPMLTPDINAPFQQGGYTLDSGDRLRVVVFGQDGLTNSYVVDASGHIDMPLIGTVSAHGLTSQQLAGRIAEALRQGYIREPHVAVEVEAYRPFFILGEVTQPGQYPYVANMTVETAVAIAGGFGPRGYRRTMIISRNSGGSTYRFEVPITYPICPGDTVLVQERWF
jgi:protein involved in polysaccharide export with SLBB domain